jgi:hypothetical protein
MVVMLAPDWCCRRTEDEWKDIRFHMIGEQHALADAAP